MAGRGGPVARAAAPEVVRICRDDPGGENGYLYSYFQIFFSLFFSKKRGGLPTSMLGVRCGLFSFNQGGGRGPQTGMPSPPLGVAYTGPFCTNPRDDGEGMGEATIVLQAVKGKPSRGLSRRCVGSSSPLGHALGQLVPRFTVLLRKKSMGPGGPGGVRGLRPARPSRSFHGDF
ncbi:hypothetical protein LX36DRAFT_99511 [Colletotrichum falcatum]|nr:hypothetical protein LX36DRAFT_99511 [Colletotrichum falcatum]